MYSKELSQQAMTRIPTANREMMEISEHIEEFMLQNKKKLPNLEFYSASALHQCGIAAKFFRPIFAIARTTGWTAHIIEQRDNNKLNLPSFNYKGPKPRSYV